MIFAQFHRKTPSGTIQEGVGDRSVVILDGRKRHSFNVLIASDECERRGYDAFQLFDGEAFTRSRPTTPVILVY